MKYHIIPFKWYNCTNFITKHTLKSWKSYILTKDSTKISLLKLFLEIEKIILGFGRMVYSTIDITNVVVTFFQGQV